MHFCGKDVATALGYADYGKAVRLHCKQDGRAKRPIIDSLGRSQQMTFIDEGNLYRLITHSKLEKAQEFESWVFDEVQPTVAEQGEWFAEKKRIYEELHTETKAVTGKELVQKRWNTSDNLSPVCEKSFVQDTAEKKHVGTNNRTF